MGFWMNPQIGSISDKNWSQKQNYKRTQNNMALSQHTFFILSRNKISLDDLDIKIAVYRTPGSTDI